MYAIVKTGGKQYKVAPGDTLAVEKLEVKEGDKVELTALCVVDNGAVDTKGATVTASVVEQFKDTKQLVFKFKKRKGYKKTQGHRQNLTRIHIESIGGAKKAAAKKASVKEDAEKSETKAAPKATAKKTEAKATDKKPDAKKTTKADSAE